MTGRTLSLTNCRTGACQLTEWRFRALSVSRASSDISAVSVCAQMCRRRCAGASQQRFNQFHHFININTIPNTNLHRVKLKFDNVCFIIGGKRFSHRCRADVERRKPIFEQLKIAPRIISMGERNEFARPAAVSAGKCIRRPS